MRVLVHIETLQTEDNGEAYGSGTVEVTINGDRRRVSCFESFRDNAKQRNLHVYGLAVRFTTGRKVWPGSITYWFDSANVCGLRPNIDKRGPVDLVGYFADYERKSVRSQHNAVA